MQPTPYSAMSGAIARYISSKRDKGINTDDVAADIQCALQVALGEHLDIEVTIKWRKEN